MFQTLTCALNMFSVRNMYYNTLDKRLLARHISKYSVSRIVTLCCNVEKKNCEGSDSGNKSQSLHIESNEKKIKCEITNLPRIPGDVDCNCKLMCMTKKSETMTITESKKNN